VEKRRVRAESRTIDQKDRGNVKQRRSSCRKLIIFMVRKVVRDRGEVGRGVHCKQFSIYVFPKKDFAKSHF
jgi:hypothetical protein